MRIVQLVTQTVLGGAETYGHALAVALSERGHDVKLLANRRNGPLFEKPRPESLELDALARTSRLDPAILSFLVGHLRSFRPDVLHAHNFGANTWARALGLFFPRMVVVCHVHAGRMVTSQPAHRALIDRLLFRRADLVIGLNEEMMAYLTGRLRVPSDRALLLPNGIDMERFAPPLGPSIAGEGAATSALSDSIAQPRDPHGVVCVASLTDVKNHATLLDAWARVVGSVPTARLTLVGDGPLRGELEAQARELSIAGSVEFVGLQSDVLPFYRRASIFVLSSRREALPLSLLEAMATGAVPIASAVGGIPEVIEGGRNGYLVEPDDVEGFANRILACLADPAETARIGRAARASVEHRYGIGAIVDRLEAAYVSALSRRRR